LKNSRPGYLEKAWQQEPTKPSASAWSSATFTGNKEEIYRPGRFHESPSRLVIMISPPDGYPARFIGMKKCLLTIVLLLGIGFGFSIEPHPDAVPNSHPPSEVDIAANVKFIVADPKTLPGIVLDETDAVLKGQWQYSSHTPPYLGIGYLHDQKSDKGEKSVTWAPIFPKAGKYEVRVSHCYNVRRSSTTPVTIIHASGKTTIRINQQKVPKHGKLFRSLGVFEFKKGKAGSVTISNEGTEGKYVIADAVQFLADSVKGEAPKL
jgi:hypothetical protein